MSVVFFLFIAFAGVWTGWVKWYSSTSKEPVSGARLASVPERAFSVIPTLDELLSMTPEQLQNVDIAVMNLRCAEGLRGAENLDVKAALEKIDLYAARVESETERNFYKFRSKPQDFNNSIPFFKMLLLTTVLQEDFGIRYDPALKVGFPPPEDDHFFDDSRNVLLNGLIDRQMGSCASLPVLYVAVGRRLGYPLKLVPGNSHLYLRWQDSRTRLNVEATTEGFVSHPDEEYWKWPTPVTPLQAEKFALFKSFNNSGELACFLSARGEVLMANDDYEGALKCHELAARTSPHSQIYRLILSHVRPFVEKRRAFDAQNNSPAQAALNSFAEEAWLNRMNGQRSDRLSPLSPASPIPPDPRPGQPMRNGFTHGSGGNRSTQH